MAAQTLESLLELIATNLTHCHDGWLSCHGASTLDALAHQLRRSASLGSFTSIQPLTHVAHWAVQTLPSQSGDETYTGFATHLLSTLFFSPALVCAAPPEAVRGWAALLCELLTENSASKLRQFVGVQ